jgi:hypothetical protein
VGDEEIVRLRPRDLATVWGTALGQLIELWRAAWTAFLEAGGREADISGDQTNQFPVRTVDGHAPRLIARDLVGESFGLVVDGRFVTFTERGAAGPDLVLIECGVNEERGQPIHGDIYRGRVEDENGNLVARIALDAGS